MNQDVLTLAKQLIDQRRSRRFQLLFEAQSVLRFICLYKNLQLTGSKYIQPIFISFCEITSTCIDLLSELRLKQTLTQQTVVTEIKSTTPKRGGKQKQPKKLRFMRSVIYNPLIKEEDELEEWNQKQRKGIYKLARKVNQSATKLLNIKID